MQENIILKNIPRESGVYWFTNENGEVIYVGSSKNLYKRILKHKCSIKHGSNHGGQTDLYQFLQSNQFKVEFELTTEYVQKEQELIKTHKPIYNKRRAFAGIKCETNDRREYYKKWHSKYREEHLKRMDEYIGMQCFYKGEYLSLSKLRNRLKKLGYEHPVKEAKKYLVK